MFMSGPCSMRQLSGRTASALRAGGADRRLSIKSLKSIVCPLLHFGGFSYAFTALICSEATNSNRMSKAGCDFLDKVRRRQHRCWLALLCWSICVELLVAVISNFFTNIPHVLVFSMFYVSSFFLLIQLIALYRLKCPHCRWFAGVLPSFRYKFINCRACGKRIDCP
jgi:Mn2+/Fe2+ NRAMP family transporter